MLKKHFKFKELVVAMLLCLPLMASAQDWRATAPYQCSFEDPVENAAWMLLNGDSSIVNKWYIDSAMNNTVPGAMSLYVSADTGATCGYADSVASTVIAYRDFTLDAGLYTFSFDWLCVGEQNYDILFAALVPADDTLLVAGADMPVSLSSFGLPEGWINLGPATTRVGMGRAPDWTRQQSRISVPQSGNWRLVFIDRKSVV